MGLWSASWSVKPMHTADFHFDLPPAQIAQEPLPERTASRLLDLTGALPRHRTFTELPALLRAGDLLVLNDTQVIKARLHATKDSGGRAEVLLERALNTHECLAQVRVSKPLKNDRTLHCSGGTLTVVGREGVFYRLRSDDDVLTLFERSGEVPLPPYIARSPALDDERSYQTVYADAPGAVAAPTAGLHFDEALLATLSAQAVARAFVTLHVGAGTFSPIRGDVAQHRMHQERYQVPGATAQAIAQCRERGGRVVAVGTTVVRTLESAALAGDGNLRACDGETELFIQPGFDFQVVDALITNFHLPESTLLMLVCAFGGNERVLQAYQTAVRSGYRFFSYGDAMLVLPQSDTADV